MANPIWFRLLHSAFFLVLGCAILWYAETGNISRHPATFFVLIVLGSASFLYGTGTSSFAHLNNEESFGKYSISVAGGAGVLAFLIAYGLVHFQQSIPEVFAPRERFAKVLLQWENTAPDSCKGQYWLRLYANGLNIPVQITDNAPYAYFRYESGRPPETQRLRGYATPKTRCEDGDNSEREIEAAPIDIAQKIEEAKKGVAKHAIKLISSNQETGTYRVSGDDELSVE